jgi:NAD(P)-dependent dehydrogenase (short-subunit alcohol dehydrogenase family)
MTENGRVALVSGGNRGIGLEVCRQLAEQGTTVVMGSRDGEQGRAAAAGISSGVVVRQLDVADTESVERLSRSIEDEFGRLQRRRPAWRRRGPRPGEGCARGEPVRGLAPL